MRLVRLEVSGFRGLPLRREFDLDADAVVVVGANGNGKTCFFDAILWALTGRVPRLQNDDAHLLSMYSESGQARVVLELRSNQGESVTIVRSFDGTEKRISLEQGGRILRGPAAEAQVLELLWPDAANASSPADALATVITRSVYLQQDLVRQFVEAATDQERFVAVSELVGSGRVAELQGELERAKKAWTSVTNQRREESRPLAERLAQVEARLAETSAQRLGANLSITDLEWGNWWSALREQKIEGQQVDSAARDAPFAVDNAIRELDARCRMSDRRLRELVVLKGELASLVLPSGKELLRLRDAVVAARADVDAAKQLLIGEQGRLAELRRRQASERDNAAQVQALASLALRQLGDRCPVCAQPYDKNEVRRRLESLVEPAAGSVQPAGDGVALAELLAALSAKEQVLARLEVELVSTEQEAARFEAIRASCLRRMAELEVTSGSTEASGSGIESGTHEADRMLRQLLELKRQGESLALRLAQTAGDATREELRRDAHALRGEIADTEKLIAGRNETGETAQRVIEALREASSTVVERRLAEITPLLQGIYVRIDPHPVFRAISFLSRISRGKGHLTTIITDPDENKHCDYPAAVLSSSQVNALAVSVFLSLNLSIANPPLAAAMLDDPLQSLDDINLLGLVDLLRRTKSRRQLVISTHDVRFGSLLARKLRPSDSSERTVVIELGCWGRRGPRVESHDVSADPAPLRFVGGNVG